MRNICRFTATACLVTSVLAASPLSVQAQVPQIVEQPVSTAVCVGDDAFFWVEATGPDLHYQWWRGTIQLTGETSDTLHLVAVTTTHAGYYFVVVSNTEGSVTSDSATLTVDTGPTISQQPQSRNICAGTPATLSVTASTNVGTLSYQWFHDDLEVPGATDSTLEFVNPTITDSGEYRVRVTSDCGNILSAGAILNVDDGPAIIEQPESAAVCVGEACALEVTISNQGATYLDVAGSSGYSATAPRLRGNYYHVTKNIYLTKIEQYLRITTAGPLVFFVYQSDTLNGPYALVLEDNVASAGPGTGYFSSNSLNFPLESGKYYIFGAGWPGSHTFYWSASINQPTSFGSLWKGFGSSWQTPLPDPAPTNTADYAYMQRITTSDLGFTFQWFKDDVEISGASSSRYSIPVMSEAQAGEYFVRISSDCGLVDSDPAQLSVQPPAEITQQPQPQYICTGGNAYFEVIATGPDLSYQWRKDGLEIEDATESSYTIEAVEAGDAGYYSVVIDNGCTVTSNSARLIVQTAAPTITQQPQSLSRCVGQVATFSVTASGSQEQYTFQWYKDELEITGADEPSYTIEELTLDDAGEYSVEVSNGCGSTMSDVVTLAVGDALTIETQPAGPEGGELCEGERWEFAIETTGSDIEYQWKKDGQNIEGATESIYVIEAAVPDDAGTYTVEVTNDCDSLTSEAITILVVAFPAISEQPEGVEVQAGHPFELEVAIDLSTLNEDVDAVGAAEAPFSGTNRLRANVYAVEQTTTLMLIEQYLNIATSGALKFFVYESVNGYAGPYTLIKQVTIASSGTGEQYYGSGSLSVRLEEGRHYIIGAAWTQSCTYYRSNVFSQWPTAFGHLVKGYSNTYTGTLSSPITPNLQDAIWHQRLTTVRIEGYCQWRRNGVDIPDATSEVYSVTSASLADGGVYDVVISNACGDVASDEVVVRVHSPEIEPVDPEMIVSPETPAPPPPRP